MQQFVVLVAAAIRKLHTGYSQTTSKSNIIITR